MDDQSVLVGDEQHRDVESSSTNASSKDRCALLEMINNECLKKVFQYLNLFDATNLASTCSRLLQFANSDIFPKKAKEIEITMDREICQSDVIFSTYIISEASLQNPFRYFGNFVEHLHFTDWINVCNRSSETEKDHWFCSFEKTMKLCPNLKKLTIHNCELEIQEMQILKDVVCSLNELEISSCDEIVWSYCSDLWKEGLSQLEQITVTSSKISCDLLRHCTNLSKLAIDFDNSGYGWKEEDFAGIFDRNGHCLKRLTLQYFYNYQDDAIPIATLIAEKLPNLISLKTDFLSHTLANYTVSELQHLKQLEIRDCNKEVISSNLLMRNLSDRGIIEELIIEGNSFHDEDINEPPLVYKHLQKFNWMASPPCLSLLKAITKSEMPKITDFALDCFPFTFDEEEVSHELFAFIQSKNTLKSIQLLIMFKNPFAIVTRLIEILKSESRPFLSVAFLHHEFYEEEEVSKSVL